MRRLSFLAAATAVFTVMAAAISSPALAIVGGTEVPWSQYPYFARVNGCSGTLIGSEWTLTAAHCIHGEATIPVELSNGAHTNAIEVRTHPLYDGTPWHGHDLALVKISSAVTAGVARIQVGSPFQLGPYLPQEATIVGIGQTGTHTNDYGTLRDADTPLRGDDYMDDIYNPWYWFDDWIEPLMIGAGSTGQTICFGDSGGPLISGAHNPHPIQVGVASWGGTSATSVECDRPAAYMELNGPQLAWIAVNVPEVAPSWESSCLTVWNTIGHPAAQYGTGSVGLEDGPYHWSIWCSGPMPPPPPPGPGPSPGPDDPPPPGCVRYCGPGATGPTGE